MIRSGSIGAGAKALGLTQPAVSKIIGDMESYFGSELIVRRNTGVSLTEAGQVFLNWSETITREMKNMVNEMNALTNSTVVDVSFGFPSLVGFTFMSEMVHQFKMTFPKARVSMYEAQLSAFLPAIRDGRLDFAIGTLSDEMKLQDLHVEPLFESEFVLVANRARIGNGTVRGLAPARAVGAAGDQYGLLQRTADHPAAQRHPPRKYRQYRFGGDDL